MRILDRYIILDIIRAFVSTILLFCVLYILIDLATNLNECISNKVPTQTIITYYLSFFPLIFVQTAPIACLMSVLFTYSSLNNNNEVIALRAGGLDFWKITRPAIIFAFIAAAFVFLVNERFVPASSQLSQEIREQKIDLNVPQNKSKPQSVKYLFFYGADNKLFFIDLYDPSTKLMTGLTIIKQDSKQRMTEKVTAGKAEWTGATWRLSTCQIAHYNPEDQTVLGDVQFFKETTMKLEERPEDLLQQRTRTSSMNIRDLKDYIKRFKGSGAIAVVNSLRVDLYQQIAYPFACIVIIFTGLPFALVTGRRKGLTFASIGIALVIGFLFYVLNAISLALGKGGVLPPLAAAWFTPLLFSSVGVYLIHELF